MPEGASLGEGLAIYWQAWFILRDDRHYGDYGAVGMIYYSSISQYARDFSITGEDFDTFLYLLRAMDSEYMAHVAKKKPPPDNTEETNP